MFARCLTKAKHLKNCEKHSFRFNPANKWILIEKMEILHVVFDDEIL